MARTERVAPRFAAVAIFAGLSLALGGCAVDYGTSNTTPTTVSSDDVAGVAADTLEGERGERPEIDCGSDAFDLEDGASRTCTLVDSASGDEFDVEVTLVDVAGTDYRVEAEVAEQPTG